MTLRRHKVLLKFTSGSTFSVLCPTPTIWLHANVKSKVPRKLAPPLPIRKCVLRNEAQKVRTSLSKAQMQNYRWQWRWKSLMTLMVTQERCMFAVNMDWHTIGIDLAKSIVSSSLKSAFVRFSSRTSWRIVI